MISYFSQLSILYLSLLLTNTIFVNLPPQSSFAQTTNTNQTSTEVKSQPKALTTSFKLTEPTAQGPEYKAGPHSSKDRILPKDYKDND